jgi:NCS1 family nucleobase:cation symporter-1
LIYGTTIWDPLVLAGRFDSKLLVSVAMICVAISTLATNIAANIVSPANDFANLAPKRIDFKMGGYITGVIGILIFPWKLIADPNGYIFTWLIAYSSLLGPIGGIMIADYFFIRRQQLDVADLYSSKGRYSYGAGFNRVAVVALLLGILPNAPGFLVTIKVVSPEAMSAWINDLYHYAWFVGFLVSGAIYLSMMKRPMLTPASVTSSNV